MPLIVLEGLDGAGKSTQLRLLEELFDSRGYGREQLHFPRFDSPVYGELIARFLRGEMGDIDGVDPYLVALLFAGDRAEAAPLLREWLDSGKYVILDRYVNSNIAYQCAKIAGRAKQDALMKWILDLEYGHNDIPRPDISIFMDVPFEFTVRNLASSRDGDDREYLKGGRDIHESSLDFQLRVRDMYLRIAEADESFCVVNCADSDGFMGKPEDTFVKITAEIDGLLRKA